MTIRRILSQSIFVRTTVLAQVCIGLWACAKDAAEDPAAVTAVNVRTAIVTAQTFTERVGALGTITAQAGRMAALSAPAPTRVSQVNAVAGKHVSTGEVLVVFEQTVFREAARSAEAKLTAAQGGYERARTLAAAGILPRKDVEQASADLAAARADVAVARKTLQMSVLRSPITGVVTRMSAVLGASVDANQPLVEIADPTALDVLLGMTPTDAGKVRVGNKVELRAGQNQTGELLGAATIRDISAMLDSASRNVLVRAVAPATTRPLKIGETVYGEVAISSRPNVIAIPVEGLVPEGDGFRVFVVDTKNVVHARAVKIGARESGLVEITDGLAAGVRIVTFGAYGLEDGATVVPGK